MRLIQDFQSGSMTLMTAHKRKGQKNDPPVQCTSSQSIQNVTPTPLCTSPPLLHTFHDPQQASYPPNFFTVPTAPYYPELPGHLNSRPMPSNPENQFIPSPAPYYPEMPAGLDSTPGPSNPQNQFIPACRIPSLSPSDHCSRLDRSSPLTRPSSSPTSSTPSSAPSVSRLNIEGNGVPGSPNNDAIPENNEIEDLFYDGIGRLLIEPEGDMGFYPPKANKRVFECVKQLYRGPWRTWREIPPDKQNAIFARFTAKVAWAPKFEKDRIFSNFGRKVSQRLSDTFSELRKQEEWVQPSWVGNHAWEGLLKKWASEKFKKQSAQAKAARNTGKGGSVHTGGSISYEAHRRKMRKKIGRWPTIIEVFDKTHTRKTKDGKRIAEGEPKVYVDPRSAKAVETYHENVNKWRQSQPIPENGELAQPSVEESQRIWVDSMGDQNSGKIYGVGSQLCLRPLLLGLNDESSSTNPSEIAELQEQVKALKEELKESKKTKEKDAKKWKKVEELFVRMNGGERLFSDSSDSDEE